MASFYQFHTRSIIGQFPFIFHSSGSAYKSLKNDYNYLCF